MRFSYYKCPISNTVPSRVTTLPEIYQMLVGDKFKFETQRCRVANDSVKKELKKSKFDYVTFSGEFTKRSATELIQHSGLLTLDFDKVNNVDELKIQLLEDNKIETGLLFRSPSRNGLKWIIPIDLGKATHKEWFQAVANYIRITYSVEVDASGKDVARACFLCHDPEAYFNPMFSGGGAEVKQNIFHDKFDPLDWLSGEPIMEVSSTKPKLDKHYINNEELYNEVENAVSAIEQSRLDLTNVYSNWRDIGFALADSLGEQGREFYHRISKFYPEYDKIVCDKQYQRCMDSDSKGITISTLFFHVKNAGVLDSIVNDVETNEAAPLLPYIPVKVYENLPELLKKCTEITQGKREKDILLLGSIVTISSCLQNVTGIYDNKKVFSNLFFFLSGKAGSGKSILENCKGLVILIHEKLKKQSEELRKKYSKDIANYNSEKKENPNMDKPLPPNDKVLIIPANISSSGMTQLLANNNGRGLIFETEGDTLANTFKNKDFGDFSDGFRKAFHNENISLYRKTNSEFIEIEKPQLAAVLSGTPKQILSLIPDAENGLFSRFTYYTKPMESGWKNVFANKKGVCYEDYFEKIGRDFYNLYTRMEKSGNISFEMTSSQESSLNDFFEEKEKQLVFLYGEDFKGAIHRLGLITFRIAMIFTAIRSLEVGNVSQIIICSDNDFNNSMQMVEVLMEHSRYIFQGLPKTPHVARRENQKEKFYRILPPEFTREIYLARAKSIELKEKTAEGYIKRFRETGLLNHFSHNKYLKTA